MKLITSILNPKSFIKRNPIVLILSLVLIATSCSTEESDLPIIEENGKTIVEILETYGEDDATLERSSNSKHKKPTFKTLSVALAQTGLAGTVSSNRLTVFAPTDEAFAAAGLNQRNIVSTLGVETLTKILLYHVVGGTVYSTDLSNGFVDTVGEYPVEVNVDNGVSINNANVIIADIKARNGVIHAIDNILMPPMENLTELAISSFGIDSSLVQAVIRAELAGVLAEGGPYTVFAPSQEAFDMFLADNGFMSVDDIPVDLLTQVLLYHVVDGKVFSTDLSNGYVSTLNEAAVKVDLSSGVMINDSNVIAPNIQATNGVVHVIDKVLFPPTMDLVGVASGFAPEFSILLEAATKAGLAGTLMNDGPYTVFAPTNDAFIELLAGLEGYDSLDDFDTPDDIAFLTSVLLYHVVNGRVYSSDLSNGAVPTLNGSDIMVNLDSGVMINDSEVIIPNVQATNGVIHAINKVLVP